MTRTNRTAVTLTAAAVAFVALSLYLTAAGAVAFGGAVGTSAPTTIAEDAETVWRAGWVSVALMVALWFGGQAAIERRGFILARVPWLDVGRAWALLSIVLGALVTLIPLGIAGQLDVDAFKAQGGLAAGLFLQGDMTVIRQRAEAKRLGSVIVTSAAAMLVAIRAQLAPHGLEVDDTGMVRRAVAAAS